MLGTDMVECPLCGGRAHKLGADARKRFEEKGEPINPDFNKDHPIMQCENCGGASYEFSSDPYAHQKTYYANEARNPNIGEGSVTWMSPEWKRTHPDYKKRLKEVEEMKKESARNSLLNPANADISSEKKRDLLNRENARFHRRARR